ncbi:MAG: gephyrin-like molybdotransferase Glp [Nevskiales bacterium]
MNMSLLSFDEALSQLLAGARPVGETESLATFDALGRVLAIPQTSSIAVPALDNSAMDGYAVRCTDVRVAGTRLPVAQRIPAGSVGHALASGTAARIFTGAPLPAGADAVVMQEMCAHDAGSVVIDHVPQAGEWIRRAGEDIRAGAEIITAGARLTPQQLGLAAAVGIAELPVFRRLRVALLSTGNELALPGTVVPAALPPGAIFNSNRFLLRGLLQQLGCTVIDLGTLPDELAATRSALAEAANGCDLILSSGGVSVGEEDHVRPAVAAEGELALWKIAIKPGKPLAFGRVRETAFIGLPGNPVASFVTFVMLVRPFILKAQGAASSPPAAFGLRADFDWPRADARREFLRVRRNPAGGVDLFPNQGSAVLTSVAWADGLVDNPPGQAIRRGDRVSFLPLAELLY